MAKEEKGKKSKKSKDDANTWPRKERRGKDRRRFDRRRILLAEGTALKSKDAKEADDRIAVHVKQTTLDYEQELRFLQVELLKLQQHVKKHDLRIVILFEGRDAAGKGGTHTVGAAPAG